MAKIIKDNDSALFNAIYWFIIDNGIWFKLMIDFNCCLVKD